MITIQDIFHSSDDSRRLIQYGDIEYQIENNAYKITVIDLSSIEVDDTFNPPAIGGGDWHQTLGKLACKFLHDKGLEYEVEQWTKTGKHVDVKSCCDSWVIECGDTNADVVIGHLQQFEHYAVLPFYHDKPLLFVFSRGDNYDECLRIEKQKVTDNLSKISNAISNAMRGLD